MILADRSERLFGQMIDGAIGAVPIVVAAIVSAISEKLGVVLILAAVAWSIFYYFFADGLHGGQSIGKRWLGMRVVSVETNAPCTFGQSFIRNLLLAVLGPIEWVFIFGERRQRLGDKAAGTIVVDDE
jgi:uncharacterized RDD family membrane protein YckC